MVVLIILAIWLIPILLFGVVVYYNMEKGQTVEEYLDELGICLEMEGLFVLTIPVINIVALLMLIVFQFMHFKK